MLKVYPTESQAPQAPTNHLGRTAVENHHLLHEETDAGATGTEKKLIYFGSLVKIRTNLIKW